MRTLSFPSRAALTAATVLSAPAAFAQMAAQPPATPVKAPATAVVAAAPAAAAMATPDGLIRTVSGEVLAQIKADKAIQTGDISKISALVDQKIMPYVNFQRMTASAVGRGWRSATPAQQAQLQAEFKTLLLRTYSGALAQVKDHTMQVKPLRAAASDNEVVVNSELKGKGQPIALSYRLERTVAGWKVYDLNVAGVWLVETYRADFGQVVNSKGIDGLIAALAERNKTNAAKGK